MNFASIYEVTREDYKAFIEQIKPECRDIKVIEEPEYIITKVFSINSGNCLCSRISYREEGKKEKYYIFLFPADNERRAPIPHMKIELRDKDEVQAFFNAIKEMRQVEDNNA